MNQAPRNLSAFRPIDLAAEADFALGGVRVCPSVREVQTAEGHETVEPRVMQVLVALARADGAVVSRDQLIERCWGGRLIGDDAINSCIAKVRALAGLTSPFAFDIETIPRVGYRLRTREITRGPAVASTIAAAPPAKAQPRRMIAFVAAAIVIVGAAMAAIYMFTARPREWVIVESRLPFIATPLVERSPTFSPDGTMIAYTAGIDFASRKIYLRLLNGGDPIQLTHDFLGSLSPAWSPDGSTSPMSPTSPASHAGSC